jgi:hypothetical protein
VGSCEHGYEHSDSIKGDEFLDQLSDYKLLSKVSALRKYSEVISGLISPRTAVNTQKLNPQITAASLQCEYMHVI